MVFLNDLIGLVNHTIGKGSLKSTCVLSIVQVRNATKRVSGSKTNKNDSAGRRLGPKVHEGHFVHPGQIIMRQRGTKIHPGENVGIGKDHTIFALEPGYVRFYYDPFHPLRKFVGIALKKSIVLPSPHFAPRLRRFGYVEITDPVEAEKEENHMCRKEYLRQSEILRNKEETMKIYEQKLNIFRTSLSNNFGMEGEDIDLGSERLLRISQLLNTEQSTIDAQNQVTFSHIFDLKLALRKAEISASQFSESQAKYIAFAKDFDSKVSVDSFGNVYETLTKESREEGRKSILNELESKYFNRVISKEDKESISRLISTPGMFSKAEQRDMRSQFLPHVLPLSVKETIVTDMDPKNPPKDITLVKIFDQATRKVSIIGRTKEAFLSNIP